MLTTNEILNLPIIKGSNGIISPYRYIIYTEDIEYFAENMKIWEENIQQLKEKGMKFYAIIERKNWGNDYEIVFEIKNKW